MCLIPRQKNYCFFLISSVDLVLHLQSSKYRTVLFSWKLTWEINPCLHLSSAWVLIIPLTLAELHLLSNIPLTIESCQDLISKGKYFVTLILGKAIVENAHTEGHGGCDYFGGTFQE